LPMVEKLKMKADTNNSCRGWTPLGEQTLDAKNQREGDTKEGFYFGREVSLVSPEASKPLHGPNLNPALLPHLRPTYEQYIADLNALGFRLLRLLAISLDLPPDFFLAFYQQPMYTLRPLHYPGRISEPSNGIMGAGAHTDFGLLTILATDGTLGLQIHQEGQWKSVAPIPDTFIVRHVRAMDQLAVQVNPS
jgi:isopenicillin N synthase-like dioxygenase